MSWAEDMGYDIYDDDLHEEKQMYHCGIVHETQRAVLFKISTNYGVWIPKSLIIECSEDTVTYSAKINPTTVYLHK